MKYLALLRGINVGGNAKVEMAKLKLSCERIGLREVKTYINSGNVIFEAVKTDPAKLCQQIESAIEHDFSLTVPVIVVDADSLQKISAAISDHWTTDKVMRCDVLFLWPEIDQPDVIKQLPARDGVDEVKYVPGAVIWRYDRINANKSGEAKIIGTKYYKLITIRNSNTVRKLAAMI